MNAASAIFMGMDRLRLNSIMLIVQSIVKTGLVLVLVFLGFGIVGATIGFSVGAIVAGITGVLLIYTVYSSLTKSSDGKLAIGKTIKDLLKYGLPISIGTLLIT